MKNTIFLALTVIIMVQISAGCKKKSSTTTSPGANEVSIQNMTFNPSSKTVSVNTTIKWTNNDGVAHTVTSNSSLFDSGNISSGGTYSHQFTTTGTYPYHCSIHSSMTGTITVQ